MSTKPAIPKGTRDFGPEQMMKRNYIFDTIKGVFQKYGYLPIETPAMENTATLLGKYGEEGDRLIFKILSRGEKLDKALDRIKGNEEKVALAEEALRYDLTVPFARFVVQNQNELTFPFKRYQIQPVWRADRPQRGRYREFYQCDVDVIGSDSLLNEVELIQIIDEVFGKLFKKDKLFEKKINFTIKVNNRKILQGICESIGAIDKFTDITITLDKLDKIGIQKVKEELLSLNLSKEQVEKIAGFLFIKEKSVSKHNKKTFEDDQITLSLQNLNLYEELLINSQIGLKGVEELKLIVNQLRNLFSEVVLEFDPTLARGLNYYTGAIFEVVCDDFPSSICGGGRYDDLTGIFGLKNVSGVGVSFGADRIYDVLEEQNLFPETASKSLDVFFVNFGDQEAAYCLKKLQELRAKGIKAELYPDAAKMKKQMKYANDRGARKVVMVGTKEMENNVLTVKDMETGEQQEMNLEALINSI